jgi:hypothetical protein
LATLAALTAALLAAALTSGLLILLARFLLGFLLLTALLTWILVLIAHEATPLRGTIPLKANKWTALWFLTVQRRTRSVTDQNHRNCGDISNDKQRDEIDDQERQHAEIDTAQRCIKDRLRRK